MNMRNWNLPRQPIPNITRKLIVLALILLTANIPRWMLAELNAEREDYSRAAVADVVQGWGGEVHLDTKALELYLQYGKDTFTRSFAPTESNTKLTVDIEERHKGIFKVPLYLAHAKTTGYFVVTAGDVREKNSSYGYTPQKGQVAHITGGDLVMHMNDAKKMAALQFKVNGRPLPTYRGKDYIQVQLQDIDFALPLRVEFEISFDARGYRLLSFASSGKDETIELQTPWREPSFSTNLPQQRDISKAGTHAIWSFAGADNNNTAQVEFYESGSVYQLSERCRKYGAFIIFFLLATFFLYEIMGGKRLHFMHYLLLTLPISLFFLVLLALSEHVGFGAAYLIATLLISALMSSYIRGIGATTQIAASFAVLEVGIFGMVYVILQSTDYALLMGSAALLIMLSLAMYLTRKIDWYNLEGKTV